MDVTLYQQVPEFRIDPSLMFCFPTRLASTFAASIERVLLPEERIPACQVEINVASRVTAVPKRFGTWKGKVYKALTRRLGKKAETNYSDKFVFDARFDTHKNIAHILDNVATPVLLARKVLREHFQKEIDIHVILRSEASSHRMPMVVYPLLGIPIITTDNDVRGEVVTVSHRKIHAIKPQIFDLEFQDCDKLAFEKVFIPRRGKRKLSNNDEVTAFLEERGFKTCYFEDYSIAEQWSIARNAKVVVALHGAALSSLAFSRVGLGLNSRPNSGVKVVEIMSAGWIQPLFRRVVGPVNGKWCSVRGQITPEVVEAVDFSGRKPQAMKAPFKNSFKVDCQTIQMALDYVCSDEPANSPYPVF